MKRQERGVESGECLASASALAASCIPPLCRWRGESERARETDGEREERMQGDVMDAVLSVQNVDAGMLARVGGGLSESVS